MGQPSMLPPVLTDGAWPCVPSPWLPCLGTAGEDAVRIQPTLKKMKASGVRAILDYAAVECSGACRMPASAPQRSAEQCNAHDPARLPLRSSPPRRAGSLQDACWAGRLRALALIVLRPLPLLPLLCAEDDVAEDDGPQSRQGPQASGALRGRPVLLLAISVCCTPVVRHGCHRFLAPAAWFATCACCAIGSRCAAKSAGAVATLTCQPLKPPFRTLPKPHTTVIVRTYTYESERVCDARMSIFLKSIEAAHSAEGQGFAGACLARCWWLVGAGMVGPVCMKSRRFCAGKYAVNSAGGQGVRVAWGGLRWLACASASLGSQGWHVRLFRPWLAGSANA